MIYYAYDRDSDQDLLHYGIPKMRWHVRRFQNSDGTLTAAGKERYGSGKQKRRFTEKLVKTNPREAMSSSSSSFNTISLANSKQIKSVAANVTKKFKDFIASRKEAQTIREKFYNKETFDKAERNKWTMVAADEDWEKNKGKYIREGKTKDSVRKSFIAEVDERLTNGVYDTPALEAWIKYSNSPEAKKLLKLEAEIAREAPMYKRYCLKELSAFIDGDKRTPSYSKNLVTAEALVNRVLYAWDNYSAAEKAWSGKDVTLEELMKIPV